MSKFVYTLRQICTPHLVLPLPHFFFVTKRKIVYFFKQVVIPQLNNKYSKILCRSAAISRLVNGQKILSFFNIF